MIRSTPFNLAKIYNQGRADAGQNKPNENLRWTPNQAAEYWAGWYSVKAPNGSIPGHTIHSDLDLY